MYCDETDENYDKTICGVVTKGCNLSNSISKLEWWEGYGRKMTTKKVNLYRNDTMRGIKNSFYGK